MKEAIWMLILILGICGCLLGCADDDDDDDDDDATAEEKFCDDYPDRSGECEFCWQYGVYIDECQNISDDPAFWANDCMKWIGTEEDDFYICGRENCDVFGQTCREFFSCFSLACRFT